MRSPVVLTDFNKFLKQCAKYLETKDKESASQRKFQPAFGTQGRLRISHLSALM